MWNWRVWNGRVARRDADQSLVFAGRPGRSMRSDYVYEIMGARRIQPTDGELLFQPDNGTILLLTCIGYDPLTGDYAERLLVEAKLVQEPVDTQ